MSRISEATQETIYVEWVEDLNFQSVCEYWCDYTNLSQMMSLEWFFKALWFNVESVFCHMKLVSEFNESLLTNGLLLVIVWIKNAFHVFLFIQLFDLAMPNLPYSIRWATPTSRKLRRNPQADSAFANPIVKLVHNHGIPKPYPDRALKMPFLSHHSSHSITIASLSQC